MMFCPPLSQALPILENMGFVVLSDAGLRAMLFYLVTYYLMNLGAFLVVVLLPHLALLAGLLFLGQFVAAYLTRTAGKYAYAGLQMGLVLPLLVVLALWSRYRRRRAHAMASISARPDLQIARLRDVALQPLSGERALYDPRYRTHGGGPRACLHDAGSVSK